MRIATGCRESRGSGAGHETCPLAQGRVASMGGIDDDDQDGELWRHVLRC